MAVTQVGVVFINDIASDFAISLGDVIFGVSCVENEGCKRGQIYIKQYVKNKSKKKWEPDGCT
jgi:hypothetical protein